MNQINYAVRSMHYEIGYITWAVYFGPDDSPDDYLYEIANYAYARDNECHNYLAEITFPSQLKRLGAYSFQNCNNLVSVTLNNTSVSSILKYTFDGCTALKTVNLPTANKKVTITSIGEYAFYNCANLSSSFTFGDNIEGI